MSSETYIHSACHNAHWELIYKDGAYILVCEKCGKSIGADILVMGPDMGECPCSMCEAEKRKEAAQKAVVTKKRKAAARKAVATKSKKK